MSLVVGCVFWGPEAARGGYIGAGRGYEVTGCICASGVRVRRARQARGVLLGVERVLGERVSYRRSRPAPCPLKHIPHVPSRATPQYAVRRALESGRVRREASDRRCSRIRTAAIARERGACQRGGLSMRAGVHRWWSDVACVGTGRGL